MTAQARAADRWHMATGEQKAVTDDAEMVRIKALEKWAEDFAAKQQKILSTTAAIHERVDSLVDLIAESDRKAGEADQAASLARAEIGLAMAQIQSLTQLLDKTIRYIEPKRKLEEARALVEADALVKAEKWRKRLDAARPIAFVFLLAAFMAVAAMVFIKTGINIVPMVME